MPDEIRLITEDLRAKHGNVDLVTPIFQSDDPSIDGGVCRGVAARWIGAQILGDQYLVNFRLLATNRDGKVDKEFVRYQSAFNAVAKEFETTRAKFRKLVEVAERARGLYEGSIKPGWFESVPKIKDVNEAEDALLRYTGSLKSAAGMLQRYMSGGLYELTKVGGAIQYATFEQALHTHLTGNGFYYVSLGGTHAMAFYVDQAGECMFLDANTGEWVSRTLSSMSNFFADYMSSLYKGHYNGSTVTLYHYATQLQGRKIHFTSREADYSSVSIGNFFD